MNWKIDWNTIISSAFPLNIPDFIIPHYICIHVMDYATFFTWMLYRD